jgi:ATP-dependent Clp protease ATP-binding subunit ClpC
MNREIYPKVKLIINQAIKEAESFDDVKIRPEHLILSILLDEDNISVQIFKKLKVDIPNLHDIISDFLRKEDLTPRINVKTTRKPPFSDETKLIFKTVDKECEKLDDKMIDTQHIMLSILTNKLPINNVLDKVGINYKSFREIVLSMKDDFKNSSFDDSETNEGNDLFKKQKPSDSRSKTPVLDNFCRDISKAVENGEIDPVVGRQVEIKRVSQILSRRKKNNPILIGEPGTGKTSIVEGLAQLIKEGNDPNKTEVQIMNDKGSYRIFDCGNKKWIYKIF